MQDLLESLSDPLREQGNRALDDKERTNWHFVPRQRKGVSLKEMDANQRRAAHALLRSALSSQGYLKAKAIMELEAVLFALESRPDRPARHRDPELYWFMVFGEPSTEKPWAWRVEGHHLSLNFTVVEYLRPSRSLCLLLHSCKLALWLYRTPI